MIRSVSYRIQVSHPEYAFDGDSQTEPVITILGGPVVSNVYNTANNNPQGQINALEFTMDGNGLITRYSDTLDVNSETSITYHEWYDHQGNKHQDVNNPFSDSKTVTDGSGRVISSTDANGQTTSTFYNSLGQVIDVQDPYFGHTYTLYDIRGNAVATPDP